MRGLRLISFGQVNLVRIPRHKNAYDKNAFEVFTGSGIKRSLRFRISEEFLQIASELSLN